jgi:hypothetical protein
MTFSKKVTLSMTFSKKVTLSIATFSITTLSMTFSKKSDTQHNSSVVMLSLIMLNVSNNPFILSVVMLNVVALGLTTRLFLSPGASSRYQTLDLTIMRRVFYHCATGAQQVPSITHCYKRTSLPHCGIN